MEGRPLQGGFLEGAALSWAWLEKTDLQLFCKQMPSSALSLPLYEVSSREAIGEGCCVDLRQSK